MVLTKVIADIWERSSIAVRWFKMIRHVVNNLTFYPDYLPLNLEAENESDLHNLTSLLKVRSIKIKVGCQVNTHTHTHPPNSLNIMYIYINLTILHINVRKNELDLIGYSFSGDDFLNIQEKNLYYHLMQPGISPHIKTQF